MFPLILLCGGKSTRMGRPKGLLEINGRPWVVDQIEQFRVAGGKEIVVVLGFHADAYRAIIETIKEVTVVVNDHPSLGQFSSLLVGCRALPRSQAAFVLPIDVPVPGKDVWQKLAAAMKGDVEACMPVYQARGGPASAKATAGGHPVLLSTHFIKKLLTIAPDHSDARLDVQIHQLDQGRIARIPVDDERVVMNVNTPNELPLL